MILGIGTDLIEVERVAEKLEKKAGFRELVFSAHEIAYCERMVFKYEHYAARFAAKEATAKTLQTGFKGLSFKEIEVVRNSAGAPSLKLSGRASALAAKLNLSSFELTISHEREYAIAFVLGYGETPNRSR